MIAKFSRPCVHCGVAIKPGKDIYDVATKRSYHEACETAAAGPAPDAAGLADQLGYIPFSQDMDASGLLFKMQPKQRVLFE